MPVHRTDRSHTPKISNPACQVSGCFEPASVYVVIKETEIDSSKLDSGVFERSILSKTIPTNENNDQTNDINTFKLILYLCARHDYDLKYLLKGNELEIIRRRHLILKEIR